MSVHTYKSHFKYIKGYAYKHGGSEQYALSHVIASNEGKLYVKPRISVPTNRKYTGKFFLLTGNPDVVELKIQDSVTNPFYASYYVYNYREVNVGDAIILLSAGLVPVLPKIFKDDFGECGVYFHAELKYPRVILDTDSLYTMLSVVKNGGESLYKEKLTECKKFFS